MEPLLGAGAQGSSSSAPLVAATGAAGAAPQPPLPCSSGGGSRGKGGAVELAQPAFRDMWGHTKLRSSVDTEHGHAQARGEPQECVVELPGAGHREGLQLRSTPGSPERAARAGTTVAVGLLAEPGHSPTRAAGSEGAGEAGSHSGGAWGGGAGGLGAEGHGEEDGGKERLLQGGASSSAQALPDSTGARGHAHANGAAHGAAVKAAAVGQQWGGAQPPRDGDGGAPLLPVSFDPGTGPPGPPAQAPRGPECCVAATAPLRQEELPGQEASFFHTQWLMLLDIYAGEGGPVALAALPWPRHNSKKELIQRRNFC